MAPTAVPFELFQRHKQARGCNKTLRSGQKKKTHAAAVPSDRESRAALNRQLEKSYQEKRFFESFKSSKSVALQKEREIARATLEKVFRKRALKNAARKASTNNNTLAKKKRVTEEKIRDNLTNNKLFQATLQKLQRVYDDERSTSTLT